MKIQSVCKNCGFKGYPIKKTEGSIAIELVLWLLCLIPGIIYSIWRLTTRKEVCPMCGQPGMIPANSPLAKSINKQKNNS
jgi:ribosomal protein L37E